MRRQKKLGFGFSDEVFKVNQKTGHFQKQSEQEWKDLLLPNYNPVYHLTGGSLSRLLWLGVLSIILFFAIFMRLFHLQIVKGFENRRLADGNRVQVRIIHAPRGVIFDRNGKVLASNSPGFRLTDPKTRKIRFITREEALELEVKNDPLTRYLEIDTLRSYPKAEETAHILGYVGEISKEELKEPRYQGYLPGDRVGKSGVEYQYENVLKGKDGGEIIEVDAQGKKVRTIRIIPPQAGLNLTLSIDSDLQHQAYILLKEAAIKKGSCCGAVIAEDPQTGQILTLVSYPSYDNNIFITDQSGELIGDILSSKNSPVLNRAIAGTYPPGSTFKIISSLAALDSGKVTPKTIFEDTGEVNIETFKFTNWYFTQYGRKEGAVDLVKALQRSNDTYYYQVGQKIGEQPFIDWSKKLKLGSRLDIDLPGEVEGLVPNKDWKLKNFDQPWYPGDTLHMSIGQGFVLTTPLQVLGFTSFIADNGTLYKPQIALNVLRNDKILKEFNSQVLVDKITTKENINIIKQGLEEVPKNGGTAWPFFTFPLDTAGKTGTAEFGDPDNKTHAWYTAYAPIDEPKIAVTVLIEAGGEGSTVASPIAKEVFRWFLSPDKNALIKDVGAVATDSARTLGE